MLKESERRLILQISKNRIMADSVAGLSVKSSRDYWTWNNRLV